MTQETAAAIEELAGLLEGRIPTVARAAWITRASQVPANGKGHSRSFADPRRRGLSENWGQTTLARLRDYLEQHRQIEARSS
jgi:hypothetical protein